MYDYQKYQLAYCEVYHPTIHGADDGACLKSYLINRTTSIDDIMQQQDDENAQINFTRNIYKMYCYPHPYIRNYIHILKKINYVSLEIVEHVTLDDGTHVGILKTFWIKIFQRKWRNLQRKLRFFKHPYGAIYAECKCKQNSYTTFKYNNCVFTSLIKNFM